MAGTSGSSSAAGLTANAAVLQACALSWRRGAFLRRRDLSHTISGSGILTGSQQEVQRLPGGALLLGRLPARGLPAGGRTVRPVLCWRLPEIDTCITLCVFLNICVHHFHSIYTYK